MLLLLLIRMFDITSIILFTLKSLEWVCPFRECIKKKKKKKGGGGGETLDLNHYSKAESISKREI